MSLDVVDNNWWLIQLGDQLKIFQSHELLETWLLQSSLHWMQVQATGIKVFHFIVSGDTFEVIKQGNNFWRPVAEKLMIMLAEGERENSLDEIRRQHSGEKDK